MRDDRPTSKMEAVDLRMLADATADRQRPTNRINRADLLTLLWEPEPPSTAHVISRAGTLAPEVVEGEIFDAPTRPIQLVVITTPQEMRERWLTWVRVRASVALTLVLTLALVAAIHLV